jgi:hypothetical protein
MSSVKLNAFDFIDDNNQHFIDEQIQSTIDNSLLMHKNRKMQRGKGGEDEGRTVKGEADCSTNSDFKKLG